MFLAIAQWLQDTPLAQWISTSSYGFPWIETIHVICLVTVVGTICILDLRLLYVASRSRAVTELTLDVLPFTWGAFVLAVITGSLMFSSKATEYIVNPPFLLKMLCIALAGINMGVFHFITYRSVHQWNHGVSPPRGAKIASTLSLTFWILVIIFGRWIGFTVR